MVRYISALVAAFVLVACGQGAPAQAQDASGKPTQAAAPALSGDAQMFVGRWGDNGDCSKDIVFNADGTFQSFTGGSGAWSLNGDVMTMAGSGGTFQVRVTSIDANTMRVTNPDGSVGLSQRCP